MQPITREELSHAPRNAGDPQRILVATDLSQVGESAIQVAHARADETAGRLAVCHVITDPPKDPVEAQRRVDEVHRELRASLKALLGDHAHEAEVFVPIGDPARQLHDCAEAWSADLVVVGRPEHASGVLARLFKPKVVDKVVRRAPCAVLVTRRAPGTRRIVVGIDLTEPAQEVLERAAAEQARSGGSVYVVHCVSPATAFPVGDPAAGVIPPALFEDLEASLRTQIDAAVTAVGLNASSQIVRDGAGDGLVQTARDLAADLVIVGTHGRSGLARLALGSVASHVVHHAPCPVMVVRLS